MSEDQVQEQQAAIGADNLATHVDNMPVSALVHAIGPVSRALDPEETVSMTIYLTPDQTHRVKLRQLQELEEQIAHLENAKVQLRAQVEEAPEGNYADEWPEW